MSGANSQLSSDSGPKKWVPNRYSNIEAGGKGSTEIQGEAGIQRVRHLPVREAVPLQRVLPEYKDRQEAGARVRADGGAQQQAGLQRHHAPDQQLGDAGAVLNFNINLYVHCSLVSVFVRVIRPLQRRARWWAASFLRRLIFI